MTRPFILWLALPALAACAGGPAFRLPAEAFYEDFRGDFGPGVGERDEGGVLALYMYPSAVTEGRCRPSPDGSRASCRFSYTYGSGWHAVQGAFARRPDGAWRYVPDSARKAAPRRGPTDVPAAP